MNDNAKAWIAALRSGTYQQARERLVQVGDDGKPVGYCCLGVACELAAQAGLVEREHNAYVTDDEWEETALPIAVLDWLGMEDVEGWYAGGSLINLNDSQKLSFEEIADVIESEPPGLFIP